MSVVPTAAASVLAASVSASNGARRTQEDEQRAERARRQPDGDRSQDLVIFSAEAVRAARDRSHQGQEQGQPAERRRPKPPPTDADATHLVDVEG